VVAEPEPVTEVLPVEELKEITPEKSVEPEPEVEVQEEETENKIVEETPAELNPILVRNQQISEDENEKEYSVSEDNVVYAWGSAECDQFECTNYESRRPVEISYFSSNKINVAKITCGSQHTLLLDSAGKVYSWGNSDDGALGRHVSSSSNDEKPGLVDLDGQVDLISAGDAHSCFANSQTGELYFSGVIKSSNGKLSRVVDLPESVTISKFKKSGIKSVLSGANHVLIHSRFNVYAFGDNSTGALGYILRSYDERSDCLTPHALRLKGIARIFTGAYHCFAITNKGILKTWGLNSQGQLGLPFYLDNPEDSDINHEDPNRNPNVLQLPHQVGGIDGRKVVDIVGGEHHTLMLMSDGSLWGAGRNDDGQLGGLVKPSRDSYDEVKIPNSRVRVAGTNSYVNVTIDYMPNKFMRLPIKKDFQKIMSISHYNYAINTVEKSWPKIYSWGSGFNYVLGNGKEETMNVPFRISNDKLFKGSVPTEVALGFSHVVYYTGPTNEVVLEELKSRSNKKRDRMTPLKRNNKYKGKRVKSK
jgi:regulator of chromosome condensation